MVCIVYYTCSSSSGKSAKKRNLRLSFSYFVAHNLKYSQTERPLQGSKIGGDGIDVFALHLFFCLRSSSSNTSTAQEARKC